jgi:hypothetical protein
MIELNILNAAVDCRIGEDGVRHLLAVDPQTGIIVHVMLQEPAAKELASLLTGSGLVVAPAAAIKNGRY